MGWIPLVCKENEYSKTLHRYDPDLLWCKCTLNPMEVEKMEFDKNKVLTIVNSEKATIGKMGWFDDTLIGLKKKVLGSDPQKLVDIQSDMCCNFVFVGDSGLAWGLFYPYEGPSVRYLDRDEMNSLVGKVVSYNGKNHIVAYFADRKEPMVYVEGIGIQTAEQLGKNFNMDGVPLLKDI